jgi:hypothetical protein
MMIMDWTTQLEKAGVVGSDFTFTESDKQQAGNTHIHIDSIGQFTGNLGQGNVSGPITSSGLDAAAVRDLVRELRKYETDFAQVGVDACTLEKRVAALEAELKKAKPDHSRLASFLIDLRNAVSGAAGNLIASGILFKINAILGG